MRYLSLIITIPVALFAISFAISNRISVMLELWPLPFTIDAPLYLLVLGAVAVGFIAGGIVAWFAQHKYRKEARQNRSRVAVLADELSRYRTRAETAEAAARTANEKARLAAANDAANRAASSEPKRLTAAGQV
ncbi:LapA family protein [Fodinicurvata sp. EGI_FJ10296]|uniref:LapA family protein n=1 Tax=Fodinicurvata sp. EGI_FJ10296 TaxID=3231908 RepID=UPI00345474CB